MPHMTIRPFERRCICPPPGRRRPGEHTPECDDNYRAAFLDRKQQVRDEFYDTPRDRLL